MPRSVSLPDSLVRHLYDRIRHVHGEVRALGCETLVGLENEVYISGPRARTYLATGSPALRRLREAYPEIARVYVEADVVSISGTTLRLGVPGVRKWEFTTRYGADPAVQAELLTSIRSFLDADILRNGHHAWWGARPMADLRDIVAGGAGPLRVTERTLLESLRLQVRSADYQCQVREDCARNAGAKAFQFVLGECPSIDPGWLVDALRCSSAEHRIAALEHRLPGTLARDAEGLLDAEWQRSRSAADDAAAAIMNADSLSELCDGPDAAVAPQSVPALGVDLNISVWRGGMNLFFDTAEPSCIAAPLRCVAAALIELLGCETGSALPVAQSYGAEAFARLRKGNSVLSPTAAIFGAKSAGSICKRSPDSIADNPGRAIEHSFDQLNDRSARLEIRVAEAGFSTGPVNPLASPHYVLLALLAVRNGMRTFLGRPDRAPTLDALFGMRQELHTSPESAVTGFRDSVLMKDGYGSELHTLVVRHAAEILGRRGARADRVA